jgi:hypothetical protein
MSIFPVQLYWEQGLAKCPTEHMYTMRLSLFMNPFPSLPQYWSTFSVDASLLSACLIARLLNVLRLKQAETFWFVTLHNLETLDPCCRIWRPQRGNRGLRVGVSACDSMVGLGSLEQSGADRLAWSCLPLLPDRPFYQSNTHPQCCPRCPANPTGKSSSTSLLRPAHWHAVVSLRSPPTSLR